jgi:hypothetical protein
MLEAVTSENLWIWHCFFGLPGSLNDINVLQRTHLFDSIAWGDAPACNYAVNGHEYKMGYYLHHGLLLSRLYQIHQQRNKLICESPRSILKGY